MSAQEPTLAVVDFEGFGISQTETIALTNRLRNELFRLGAFNVVERGLMEDIISEQNFQMTGCTDNKCLVDLGRILGAEQIVGGTISRIEEIITVSARVIDVGSGKLIKVADYDLDGSLSTVLTQGMGEVAQSLSGLGSDERISLPSPSIDKQPISTSLPIERTRIIIKYEKAIGIISFGGGKFRAWLDGIELATKRGGTIYNQIISPGTHVLFWESWDNPDNSIELHVSPGKTLRLDIIETATGIGGSGKILVNGVQWASYGW
ncbi:DUF2380 domain-containing protein [Candidatus Neomarinimicrobiota bacterium]